jgi:hypothetical protein
MPDSFVDDNCREYHLNRNELSVTNISNVTNSLGDNIQILFLPGHSPDGIAVIIDQDIVIAGDNVLPDISPMPSKKESFGLLSPVLPDGHFEIQQTFGLEAYIRSLITLKHLGETSTDIMTLPGHRFYYNDQWNDFQLKKRTAEIIDHHLERCDAILRILADGPQSIKEIVTAHFEPSMLKGMGFNMAKNEIESHLEVLLDSSDVSLSDNGQYIGQDS